MVNSLSIYPSHLETHFSMIDEFEELLAERELSHFAGRILERALRDEEELDEAVHHSIRALRSARIPPNRHFKKVYIAYGGEIRSDWLVSDLGLRLIITHADASNPVMAMLQVELLSNK